MKFSIDQARKSAQKYDGLDVDGVRLRNPLFMTPEEREKFAELQPALKEAAEESPETLAAVLEQMIRLLAGGSKARHLLNEIDGDLGVLLAIFEAYTEAAQLGEASS